MKDRELNSAIKRASPRRRPWAKFNASPPFPSFNSWPFSSSSSLTSHSALIKSRWSLSRNFSPPPTIFFLPILCPVIPFWKPWPWPESNGTKSRPRRYRCPWQSVHLHRLCRTYFIVCGSAKLDWPDTRKSKQTLGSQILRILLHTSTSLQKKSTKGWKQCALFCLFV